MVAEFQQALEHYSSRRKMKAIYINRSDIGWYSKNANAYRKALEVVEKYEATLCLSKGCRVPLEIESKAKAIVRFESASDVLRSEAVIRELNSGAVLFTGFDFPCMAVARKLKKRFNCEWTVFCWDPPSLSHRDRFPPLRWVIDFVFRWFVKRCDRLVLNIHPGLLDEIGFKTGKTDDGQLRIVGGPVVEQRMQDAFDGMKSDAVCNDCDCEYDFGVLSNWCEAKGCWLMADALERLPDKRCVWIGDPPNEVTKAAISARLDGRLIMAGRREQSDAFEMLKKCRVLVMPYLPVCSLKWNYPLKVFEYLQLGRPIVASDNPGNAAIAEKYKGRIKLFKSGDARSLIEVMRREMSV